MKNDDGGFNVFEMFDYNNEKEIGYIESQDIFSLYINSNCNDNDKLNINESPKKYGFENKFLKNFDQFFQTDKVNYDNSYSNNSSNNSKIEPLLEGLKTTSNNNMFNTFCNNFNSINNASNELNFKQPIKLTENNKPTTNTNTNARVTSTKSYKNDSVKVEKKYVPRKLNKQNNTNSTNTNITTKSMFLDELKDLNKISRLNNNLNTSRKFSMDEFEESVNQSTFSNYSKNSIFITTKHDRSKRDNHNYIKSYNNLDSINELNDNNKNNDGKENYKLLKNRRSAKKSRDKKRNEVFNLEEKVAQLEKELKTLQNNRSGSNHTNHTNNTYNTYNSNNTSDAEFTDNKMNSAESYNFQFPSTNETTTGQLTKLDQFPKLFENFKETISFSVPLDIKIFSNKYTHLHLLDNFNSIEKCVEQIEDNIKSLDKVYDFTGSTINNSDMISLPFKIYKYVNKIHSNINDMAELSSEMVF